jgi:hypothetical protein
MQKLSPQSLTCLISVDLYSVQLHFLVGVFSFKKKRYNIISSCFEGAHFTITSWRGPDVTILGHMIFSVLLARVRLIDSPRPSHWIRLAMADRCWRNKMHFKCIPSITSAHRLLIDHNLSEGVCIDLTVHHFWNRVQYASFPCSFP